MLREEKKEQRRLARQAAKQEVETPLYLRRDDDDISQFVLDKPASITSSIYICFIFGVLNLISGLTILFGDASVGPFLATYAVDLISFWQELYEYGWIFTTIGLLQVVSAILLWTRITRVPIMTALVAQAIFNFAIFKYLETNSPVEISDTVSIGLWIFIIGYAIVAVYLLVRLLARNTEGWLSY
ncbi:MAG: hypothetical protein CR979_02290 [Propionibacterium sp.]|nr:MAG: hypothetical protein CR979_02290 [Propionibacterium sp.]